MMPCSNCEMAEICDEIRRCFRKDYEEEYANAGQLADRGEVADQGEILPIIYDEKQPQRISKKYRDALKEVINL